jgi:putative glutamine amidotransferase
LQPLIGITSASTKADSLSYHRAYAANAFAVAQAGGLPVYVPCGLDVETLHAIYDRLDGVLLPGGGDVDPVHYGREPHPATQNIDDPRDALELTIARWAVDDDMPVFGICRGHQVLNVALGGTLVQDIPSEIGASAHRHDTNGEPRTTRAHTVRIEVSSRLAALVGQLQLEVNSLHHQAVDRLAPGLVATAWADDGVIEAVEAPAKRFVLGVQWHPEDLVDDDEAMRRLFKAFIDAARERAFAH